MRPVSAVPFDGTDDAAIGELDTVLRRAVAAQMVADVPVGAFLSSGIDSSLVVSLMQAQSQTPVRTFTIGSFDKAYNEADGARRIARHLGTEHTELFVSAKDALDTIPRLPAIYDEPFGDSSQIPTCLISMLTRQHVTVSLSGDGGDELFCGYQRYFTLQQLWRRVDWIPAALRPTVARSLAALDAGRRLPRASRIVVTGCCRPAGCATAKTSAMARVAGKLGDVVSRLRVALDVATERTSRAGSGERVHR